MNIVTRRGEQVGRNPEIKWVLLAVVLSFVLPIVVLWGMTGFFYYVLIIMGLVVSFLLVSNIGEGRRGKKRRGKFKMSKLYFRWP